MKKTIFIGGIILLSAAVVSAQGPRIDVVFLLDTTGSMGDEIAAVKEKIKDMISEIASGDPAPDVRFGIVAYRDRGDEYITRVYDLTDNIDAIVKNLESIQAEGGGDYPESVNEALHVALNDIHWDIERTTIKMIFLIGDAPPHLKYENDYDYQEEIKVAQEQWVMVHAIGCSGLNQLGEDIFTEIALQTEGEFEFLAYESRSVDTEGDTVIAVTRGSTTTYTKGDRTWTAEDGGWRDGEVTYGTDDGAKGGGDAGSFGPAENNLASLITDAIKRAAEERGVEYGTPTSVADDPGPTERNVSKTSWGRLKHSHGDW